jgi:RNA polymerase sigma factor (sigma-70 family)
MNPDIKIWDDFRKGENYALSHIYFQHVQILFRYGKEFSQDDEIIKDTIQDLFFDLIRTRKNLGQTDNICFYLITSFRRKLARNIKRKNELKIATYQEHKCDFVSSVEYEIINKEELTQRELIVKNALAELPTKQREILFYRFSCGFEYEEICEIMNLQYDSARKQVSRAIKAMKEIIIKAGFSFSILCFFS